MTSFSTLTRTLSRGLSRRHALRSVCLAATVVADMARARVTSTLEKMPGMRLALGRAGGRKSSVMNSQKASPLAASTMGLNCVR